MMMHHTNVLQNTYNRWLLLLLLLAQAAIAVRCILQHPSRVGTSLEQPREVCRSTSSGGAFRRRRLRGQAGKLLERVAANRARH
ncbi:hypothetical protein FB567DRAFT_540262 [Paraphoma chrysanthemicola]|uniref:Secreted protein n=1 Tax=Paraphoma chrysanthemicola TaxID=798071 RepID=A0A8K0QT03_9PLEO|nr:hypothetical protein FB567DRAFT_540262 [Paraphoma chrysanthemicola]